jgi:predicted acylesterase/phospholipase RssA
MTNNKKYILILSGGGSRGFYTLGILKAMEKL